MVWLALNRHRAAIAIIDSGRLLYSREFDWHYRSATTVREELLQRYTLVAHLAPEIRHGLDVAGARARGGPGRHRDVWRSPGVAVADDAAHRGARSRGRDARYARGLRPGSERGSRDSHGKSVSLVPGGGCRCQRSTGAGDRAGPLACRRRGGGGGGNAADGRMVDAPECQPSDSGTGQGCGPAGPGPATAGTGSQTVTRTCRAAGAAGRGVDSGSDDRAPGDARTEASGRYRGCTSPGGRCSAAARPASSGELHPGRAGSTSGRRGRRDCAGRGRHRPARADPDRAGRPAPSRAFRT